MTDHASSPEASEPVPIDAPTHRAHVRSAVDVLRLIVGLAMILVGVATANLFDSTFLGLAEDDNGDLWIATDGFYLDQPSCSKVNLSG